MVQRNSMMESQSTNRTGAIHHLRTSAAIVPRRHSFNFISSDQALLYRLIFSALQRVFKGVPVEGRLPSREYVVHGYMKLCYSGVQLLPINFGISALCPLGFGTSLLVGFAELSLLAEAHTRTNLSELFQI